jgi:hypothetical protein
MYKPRQVGALVKKLNLNNFKIHQPYKTTRAEGVVVAQI